MLGGCNRVAPPPKPHGIASLNPCSDAVLAEVADPAQIAGLSAFSSDPATSSMDVRAARRFPALSGSVEELAALRPALVIADSFTPPTTRAALARLGIRVVTVPIAATVAESRDQIARIAALAGHPQRGAALTARIDAALADAAPPAGSAARPAVVWQGGGLVAGEGTLIAELLTSTGFSRHAAGGAASVIPLETMLANPPSVILVAGGGKGDADRLLAHPALAELKHTRRVPFPPDLLWCGGPTIAKAAARLAEVRRSLPQ